MYKVQWVTHESEGSNVLVQDTEPQIAPNDCPSQCNLKLSSHVSLLVVIINWDVVLGITNMLLRRETGGK